MKLKDLIKDLDNPHISNLHDFLVKGISSDSKSVKDDFVFIAIKGVNDDGHRFIFEAIKKGAKAVISQAPDIKSLPIPAAGRRGLLQIPKNCAWITVSNTRRALGKLAARFFNYPSRELKVIGITGTNGKTTISYLIENLFKEAGLATAVIGTINYRFKEKVIPAHNTTPGALDIQSLLDKIKKEGINYVVMEVSSHALDQERVNGINFSSAIFTNLTHDHLDYHSNMELYFQAKAKLFKTLAADAVSIINIDDLYARRLLRLVPSRIITYGLDNHAQIAARNIKFDINGTSFITTTPKGDLDIHTHLIGRYNIYNILASVSLGLAVDLEPGIIKSAINKFKFVPGRLERVDFGGDFLVFVDYAHTDDALKNVLLTLRELAKKRIIVVFGCGGNRDKTKRPKMGKIVSELADFAIITSDNPRDEEPEEIIKDITRGIRRKNYKIIPDRKSAIFDALKMGRFGDIILIAGKGHENYQIFKDRTIHFDDREIVRQCLKSMK